MTGLPNGLVICRRNPAFGCTNLSCSTSNAISILTPLQRRRTPFFAQNDHARTASAHFHDTMSTMRWRAGGANANGRLSVPLQVYALRRGASSTVWPLLCFLFLRNSRLSVDANKSDTDRLLWVEPHRENIVAPCRSTDGIVRFRDGGSCGATIREVRTTARQLTIVHRGRKRVRSVSAFHCEGSTRSHL
jgi:hypothetical protein